LERGTAEAAAREERRGLKVLKIRKCFAKI
jgi:hypothetical protein